MSYNPSKHHRRSIRLKGYDYSQAGLYFITICAQDRACLFGEIVNSENILNDAGRIVENEWLKIPQRFPNTRLHEYVVMPNHFHAILEIVGPTTRVGPTIPGAQLKGQSLVVAPLISRMDRHLGQPQGIAPDVSSNKPKTLGDMVGAFQSIVTVEYIRGVKQHGWIPFNGRLFQRNYWERIIRDEQSFHRISNYIINNPKNWKGK